ncbi:GNAT family N-acetyltransferase [Burkholderia gladioli]|nr:GNAT family N-acetyltransferase [Burkholderia gladioli]
MTLAAIEHAMTTVRALQAEDAEALHALLSRPGVATWRLEAPHRTLEWRRDWLGKLVAQRHGFGAWADGALVGFGELAPQRLRRNHVGILDLSVHDALPGDVVGRALVEAMLNFADRWLGLRRLEIDLHADHAAALALLGHYGFETEGFRRGAALREGMLVDLRMMARLVDALPVAAPFNPAEQP